MCESVKECESDRTHMIIGNDKPNKSLQEYWLREQRYLSGAKIASIVKGSVRLT